MPIHNLGKTHFNEVEKNKISDALNQIFEVIELHTINLSAEERSKYGKVGEKGKLLINKVKDFYEMDSVLECPDVDWEEFKKDYEDRSFAEGILQQLSSLQTLTLSIKIMRDYDNRCDALTYYKYAQYKNKSSENGGYGYKVDQLKQFFPKTGFRKKKE